MTDLYLLTGATGHLGTALLEKLLKRGSHIRALVMEGDPGVLPSQIERVTGDLTDYDSLRAFMDPSGYDQVCLIHAAAVISIESAPDPRLEAVNVQGTLQLMDLAQEYQLSRVLYVSSVHAIPELTDQETIQDPDSFDPDQVVGQYAKSKAKAAGAVLDYAAQGLNVSILHPSGIIGPGDYQRNNSSNETLYAFYQGKIPFKLEGGYDFVDVRDVAQGVLNCETLGARGECYILSGHYVGLEAMMEAMADYRGKETPALPVPYGLVKALAPLAERLALWLGQRPRYTPYSIYTLKANANFSYAKAARDLNYAPRPFEDSLRDLVEVFEAHY